MCVCVCVSDDFTEELLDLHDAEIQRLRQHYEDHKVLFEGVHQWEESWRLFQDLEVRLITLSDITREMLANLFHSNGRSGHV